MPAAHKASDERRIKKASSRGLHNKGEAIEEPVLWTVRGLKRKRKKTGSGCTFRVREHRNRSSQELELCGAIGDSEARFLVKITNQISGLGCANVKRRYRKSVYWVMEKEVFWGRYRRFRGKGFFFLTKITNQISRPGCAEEVNCAIEKELFWGIDDSEGRFSVKITNQISITGCANVKKRYRYRYIGLHKKEVFWSI